jgi:hypothetical protein
VRRSYRPADCRMGRLVEQRNLLRGGSNSPVGPANRSVGQQDWSAHVIPNFYRPGSLGVCPCRRLREKVPEITLRAALGYPTPPHVTTRTLGTWLVRPTAVASVDKSIETGTLFERSYYNTFNLCTFYYRLASIDTPFKISSQS